LLTGRADAEESDDMGHFAVPSILEHAFHALDGKIIYTLGLAAGLTGNVVVLLGAQGEFVQAGAVMQIAAPNHAEILKSRQTTIYRHQVTYACANILMYPLDADRAAVLHERFDDRNAWSSDAHLRVTDPVPGFIKR